MKAATILTVASLAFVKADLGDLVDNIADEVGGIASDIGGGVENAFNDIQTFISGGESLASEAVASVTQQAGEAIASLSAAAATATGDEAEVLSSLYAEATQDYADILNEINDDEDDAASMTGVTWALAGVMGGAAIFMANL